MAWRIPTEADLLTRISGTELETIRAVVLATGQIDPVDDVITQTVDLIRGYIAGCQENQLGPDGTIPVKLMGPFLSLAIMDIMSRAGGTIIDPDNQRRKNQEQAMSILRDVAACRLAIDLPSSQSAEIVASGIPTISGRTRSYTRTTEDGL